MRGKARQTGATQEVALQALFRAIASGNRSKTSRLLAESPPLATQAAKLGATKDDASTYYFEEIAHYAYAGDTPLHIAAAAYQRDIARELVSMGATPSARNRRGAEPLHYATDGIPGSGAWNPKAQYAVVVFLVNAGADPNALDKTGVAPLHRAVRTRCAAAVRALLESGADARLGNKSGSTPLHLAVQTTGRGGTGSAHAPDEQQEIIRLLLGHGAQPTDRDARGKAVKDCITSDWIHAVLKKP